MFHVEHFPTESNAIHQRLSFCAQSENYWQAHRTELSLRWDLETSAQQKPDIYQLRALFHVEQSLGGKSDQSCSHHCALSRKARRLAAV